MQQEKLVNKYIYAFFILILAVFLFCGLKEFFTAFLGSIVFYVLFKNFMFKLTRKYNFNQSLAAVIIIIISFIIVVLPIGILLGMIYNKAATLAENPETIKVYIDKITLKLNHLPFKVSTKNMGEKTAAFVTSHIGDALTSSLNVLASLLMMYFLLYFLLINTHKLEAKIIHYLPFKKSKILLFGKELVDQTYSNAIGVPTVALAQGLLAYFSYFVAGVPDAGLWAILTGFTSILPLIGTAIIWLPVSIFLLADGSTWQGVFVLLFCAIVLGNVDNLIRMIVSKRVGDVHPVVTVLGVILGLKFFSLPGLVFGPLLISYFMILIKLYYIEYAEYKDGENVETIKVNSGFILGLVKKVLKRTIPPSSPQND